MTNLRLKVSFYVLFYGDYVVSYGHYMVSYGHYLVSFGLYNGFLSALLASACADGVHNFFISRILHTMERQRKYYEIGYQVLRYYSLAFEIFDLRAQCELATIVVALLVFNIAFSSLKTSIASS